ncbi:glycoside hydrolase family 25 protein [Prevotella sp. 10(H)]|uniref:glycoside hydrolase family 25 protein n=1 Tax=Prevotella sp. 10(H) TaxID=1158294 RepID=UPI0004A6C23C|nr:GH25 family lysozyme [Prevotella sp. 10(H)]
MAKKTVKKRVLRKAGRKRKSKKTDKKKYILIFSIAAAVCLSVIAFFVIKDSFGEAESFESSKYFVKGVDVSHHNPILNWESVLEQGITFAYMKATEGTSHEDRNYRYNYQLARGTNIKVGSYHFYTFGLSGKEQAQHFLKIAKFGSGDMIPAIDVEHSPANIYSKDKDYIKGVIDELKLLENELYEHFGVNPVIYTNKDCYKLYIKGNFPDNLIWMCDLHNEPSDDIKNWRIWQFSHKGELPAVEGHIDLNYYRYSFQDFKELLLP